LQKNSECSYAKGGYGGAICNLPGFRRVNGFSILLNYIPYLLAQKVYCIANHSGDISTKAATAMKPSKTT